MDLGTIDATRSASDLFGQVIRAFTGAQGRHLGHCPATQSGTLLDEIAKASKSVHQKVLLAIEYGEIVQMDTDRPMEVDVRIVEATNVALVGRVATGEVLPDFLPRLSCFRVRVPALRARRADILALVRVFIVVFAPCPGISRQTIYRYRDRDEQFARVDGPRQWGRPVSRDSGAPAARCHVTVERTRAVRCFAGVTRCRKTS